MSIFSLYPPTLLRSIQTGCMVHYTHLTKKSLTSSTQELSSIISSHYLYLIVKLIHDHLNEFFKQKTGLRLTVHEISPGTTALVLNDH